MFYVMLVVSIFVGFAVSQVATFETTIYLHRCQTHDAFKLPPWLHKFFRTLNWLTTGQRTKAWVAVHRKHHAFSDEVGDPHSPLIFGFWKVQLQNWLLYYRETQNSETLRKYGQRIEEDSWDTIVFNHGKVGVAVGTGILCLILGWRWGLVAAFVHVILYVGILTSCVNAIGHHRVRGGYQNYSREDASNTFNYKWLAALTGGEGLHNNHHGHPRSAKFAHTEGENDIGWSAINWLAKHGWATDIHLPDSLTA